MGSDKISDGLHFSGSKCRTLMHYKVAVVRWTKLSSSSEFVDWRPLMISKHKVKLVRQECEHIRFENGFDE